MTWDGLNRSDQETPHQRALAFLDAPIMINDHVQHCAIAEALRDALPDDTPTRQVIMTNLIPRDVLDSLHAHGYEIVRREDQ